MGDNHKDRPLTITVGHEEIVIRRRYELLSILNDLLIAVWFIVGSVLFFWASTSTVGVWFFLIGSIQLMLRPLIRLTRRVHLKRIGDPAHSDISRDF